MGERGTSMGLIETLRTLRAERVTHAAFHPDGTLAAVTFEPTPPELPAELTEQGAEKAMKDDPFILAALELAGRKNQDDPDDISS